MELKYLVDPETFDKTLDEESREIATLIDTLKDMALVDKRAGIPTVVEFDHKLQELYPKRNELNEKLRELKSILANSDFFVDRELELSDEQELLRIKKDVDELERQKTRYESEKSPYLRKQESYRKNIENTQNEVKRLEKLNKDDFKDAVDTYNGIIAEDKDALEAVESSLRKYDSLIAEINRKLLPLNRKKEDIEKKLQNRLLYIDLVKKEEYEKEFNRVSKELTDIDVEIGKISNHPVYLAATARFPLKSAGTEILKNIVKQLADLAKKVPHMDTPQSDIDKLVEERDHLVKERDKAYKEKKNSNGLVKPLETRINSFSYGEEELAASLNAWLTKSQDKQAELTAEIKKVLEDKNRLAEEIDYRKKLAPEDVKPETLKETSTLEEVKASYDQAYDAYLNELTLYQNLTSAVNSILNDEIVTLETSYESSLNEDLQFAIDSLKEHKINFLGTKSRIEQEVEELMMEVVGIDLRMKFDNSPSEVEESLNEKIDALQAKVDEQMHTFFAPKSGVEEPKQEETSTHKFFDFADDDDEQEKEDTKELEVPVVLDSVEEVPVIDLQATASEPAGEPAVSDEPGYTPKDEPTTYVHEPVGEYFGEPEVADDAIVNTGEIPVFNPTVAPEPEPTVPDLESGEPVRVTDVQELGVTATEEKDRQADFTTIIPQDGPAAPNSDDEIDFSEIDDILSGVGRGR